MGNQGLADRLPQMPSVTIEGTEYTLRRLGIRSGFAFIRLLRGLLVLGATHVERLAMVNLKNLASLESLSIIFYMGAPDLEEGFIKFLAEIVGVSAEDMSDGQKFPLGSELQILRACGDHPDIQRFLAIARDFDKDPRVQKMVETVQDLGGEAPSTS